MADTSQYFGNQQLPTNAQQLTALPPQYQIGLDSAMLQRALAQSMLTRGMQPLEGQTIQTGGGAPNRYVRPSMLQALANMANLAGGASGLQGSMKTMGGIMQDYRDQMKKGEESVLNAQAPSPTPNQQVVAQTGNLAPTTGNATLQAQAAPGMPAPASATNQARSDAAARMAAQGFSNFQQIAKDYLAASTESGRSEREVAAENWRKIQELEQQQRIKAQELAGPVATPESKLAFANRGAAGGPQFELSQPKSWMDPASGALLTNEPGTNAVRMLTPEPLPTKQTFATSEARRVTPQAAINEARKNFSESFGPASQSMSNLPAINMAIKLVEGGKINLGVGSEDLTLLQKIGQRFPNAKVSPNAPNTELLRQLLIPNIGGSLEAMHATARVATEFKAAQQGSANPDWDPRSIRATLYKLQADAEQKINTHNMLLDRTKTSLTTGDPYHVTDPETLEPFRVTPNMAPKYEAIPSTEGPATQQPPAVAKPPIDLRGKLPPLASERTATGRIGVKALPSPPPADRPFSNILLGR